MVELITIMKEIPLTRVHKEISIAADQNKYCIVFDTTGNCEVFFKYKATMFEMHRKIIGVAMGGTTEEEITEELRRKTVHCMKTGD